MTYEFAAIEARRRSRVMTRDYAICYSVLGHEYFVVPFADAKGRDLLIVEHVHIETDVALQHEEILAGLANELPHSRFVNANGQAIQWTYSGNGEMASHRARML